VEVAPSGEMGLSTGPSKITSRGKPDAPPAYGQFVSVWRRDAGGTWKVAVDLGIGHDAPVLWDQPLQARVSPTAPPAGTAIGSPIATGSIADAEAQFARIAPRSRRARRL
jgi:hypothetical protein